MHGPSRPDRVMADSVIENAIRVPNIWLNMTLNTSADRSSVGYLDSTRNPSRHNPRKRGPLIRRCELSAGHGLSDPRNQNYGASSR